MAERISSTQLPLQLVEHRISENNESCLYGVDHEFVYVAGDIDHPRDFCMYIAELSVGGVLKGGDADEVITSYAAWQAFPLSDETRCRGIFVSEDQLDEPQAKVLTNKIIEELSLRNVIHGKAA
jgi:hypothetical protein